MDLNFKNCFSRNTQVAAKNPCQYERTEKNTDTISMLYNTPPIGAAKVAATPTFVTRKGIKYQTASFLFIFVFNLDLIRK